MTLRDSIEKDVVDVKDEEAFHLESKARVLEIDTFRVCGLSDEDANFYNNYPEEGRKKVFRKVTYFLSFVHIPKISTANILGRSTSDLSLCWQLCI